MDAVMGIAALLREAFPACEIHTESEAARPPSFEIRSTGGAVKPCPGRRFQQQEGFDVRYDPSGGEKQAECRAVAQELYGVLAYLPDCSGRGADMRWEITDGALHFFVRYGRDVRLERDTEPMAQLQTAVTADREGKPAKAGAV